MFTDGRFLTRQRFMVAVRETLGRAGIEYSKYCSHSFCIGVATTAASRGVGECTDQDIGAMDESSILRVCPNTKTATC